MVDGAGTLAPGEKTFRRAHVDDLTEWTPIRAEAREVAFAPVRPEAEGSGEHLRSPLAGVNHERHPMEAADRVLGGYLAVRPARELIGVFDGDEGKPHAVGVAQRQHALAEPLVQRVVGDVLSNQPVRPIAERAFGDDERGLGRHAIAVAAGGRLVPRKKGQRRAGPAGLVAIVEVPRVGIVEIDRLLDQPQAQPAGVEGHVPLGVAADRRDVVDARAGGHEKNSDRAYRLRPVTAYVGRGDEGTISGDGRGFRRDAATSPYRRRQHNLLAGHK